jgi:hypothetical protein
MPKKTKKEKKIKLPIDEEEVEMIESTSLGDNDIRKYLPDAPIVKYSELENCGSIDDILPSEKSYCFLLYEDQPNSGHWVVISRFKDMLQYFDSYGGAVDKPLKWTDKKTRKELNQLTPFLTNLFNSSDLDSFYNDVDYQSMKGFGINTCGRHCINYILNMKNNNMNLDDYYKMMKQVKDITGRDYDEIVSMAIDII